MNNYLKQLDEETREYFEILSSYFPEWLIEYIETPEMQRLAKISQACGTDYTKLYNHEKFYNILDHSVGCALIVWNFTKDKKQTLSPNWCDNRYKITAQFFADTVKRMGEQGELTREDLYRLSEKDVIGKMENSNNKELSNCFKKFENATEFFESDAKPTDDRYCISLNCKKRYINPLVNVDGEYKRVYDVSDDAKLKIDNFLN